MKALLRRLAMNEDLNFLITNRLPRRWITMLVGRVSRSEAPWVRDLSIALWKLFADVDLTDAREQRYASLHACFVRELVPGARPVDPDPDVLVSPCDAIVGMSGAVQGTRVFQAKGYPYGLEELFGDARLAERWRDGTYATLRLTSGMYHRFHAPHDGRVRRVLYHSGDTWNVNPVALARIERLFCRNERAVIPITLDRGGHEVALVAVAAILVASIRLHFADVLLHLRYRGANPIECDARLAKGDEMGWFQHGSTILVFAPAGFELAVALGERVRAGQPLMRCRRR